MHFEFANDIYHQIAFSPVCLKNIYMFLGTQSGEVGIIVGDCQHSYLPSSGGDFDKFICRHCNDVHMCCEDECGRKYYNGDKTLVCPVSGKCFKQCVADNFTDSRRAFVMTSFHNRVKKDQQIKNKAINPKYIYDIVKNVDFMCPPSPIVVRTLVGQVIRLWEQYLQLVSNNDVYVHRKDKRCFVVGVVFSLSSGLSNNVGKNIVQPHPCLTIRKINKKKEYTTFKVRDIRHGIKLIKSGFKGRKEVYPVRV